MSDRIHGPLTHISIYVTGSKLYWPTATRPQDDRYDTLFTFPRLGPTARGIGLKHKGGALSRLFHRLPLSAFPHPTDKREISFRPILNRSFGLVA